MSRYMAKRTPLVRYPDGTYYFAVRWTWRDVVNVVAGTVILGSIIALVAFVTALAS